MKCMHNVILHLISPDYWLDRCKLMLHDTSSYSHQVDSTASRHFALSYLQLSNIDICKYQTIIAQEQGTKG